VRPEFAVNYFVTRWPARAPQRGRYVGRPARTDENGIVDLPPAPVDPIPFATAAALLTWLISVSAV